MFYCMFYFTCDRSFTYHTLPTPQRVLPGLILGFRRWFCHLGKVSGQRVRYGRLEFAACQRHDRLPDGLYGVEVVYVREDVLVPLRAGKLLLEQATVQYIRRYELRVTDDGRAQLERQQTGDVKIVHPEERNVVGDTMHGDRHVGGHDKRAAGAVGRVRVLRPLFLADFPLALTHHSHAVPDQAEQQAAGCGRSCSAGGDTGKPIEPREMTQQVESVDEYIVVGLKNVARARAVSRNPAQRRDALVRQVAVRIVEVLLDDVAVLRRLELERPLHAVVAVRAVCADRPTHHEDDAYADVVV